jgi:putative membrane protein
MKKMKLIGALTAIAVGIILIVQNTQPVETKFLFIKFTMPNSVLLGLTLLIGIAIGILVSLVTSRRQEAKKKRKPQPTI